MFTGIVEEIGTVKSVGSGKLAVSASTVLEGTRPGDSIAVNGACLTVSALAASSFSVDVMPETLKRTNLGQLRPGSKVNLERALLVGGRVGGHLVQGHVDATGRVLSLLPEGGAVIARFAAPPEILRYVVEKGFIAVDGVSLTIIGYDETSFSVSLVGYTLSNTILGSRKVGDQVNLEVDIMAKYVEKLREGRGGVTLEFLSQHGFTSNRPGG
ncbi:MAG: riboflavin synthase [Dehalococcoidia bacterium]|nr:riboflavin synthase [Dehalococcoidia bacterium]